MLFGHVWKVYLTTRLLWAGEGTVSSQLVAPSHPRWEKKGFLGASGTGWEQTTAAGEAAEKGQTEGEKQLPCPQCPDLKPSL